MKMQTRPVNYRQAKRLGSGTRWRNFSAAEVACFKGNWPNKTPCDWCGGEYYHDADFMDSLQALRTTCGRPIFINSGHRCEIHNLQVGGVPGSQHEKIAADILLFNHPDRRNLAAMAKIAGFTGFGYYQNFLHVDKGRKRFWYSGEKAKKLWQS